jgi:hypothetical protein
MAGLSFEVCARRLGVACSLTLAIEAEPLDLADVMSVRACCAPCAAIVKDHRPFRSWRAYG